MPLAGLQEASLHPASAEGVIVLALSVHLSVCVSVCLTILAKRTDIQACISACRSRLKVSRSSYKVKVIGQRSRSPSPETSSFGMHRWQYTQCNIIVVTEAVSTEEVASVHILPLLHCSFSLINHLWNPVITPYTPLWGNQ